MKNCASDFQGCFPEKSSAHIQLKLPGSEWKVSLMRNGTEFKYLVELAIVIM